MPSDIVGMLDVRDARISPDGRRIAFVVGPQRVWEGPRNPHIWIVSTEGRYFTMALPESIKKTRNFRSPR